MASHTVNWTTPRRVYHMLCRTLSTLYLLLGMNGLSDQPSAYRTTCQKPKKPKVIVRLTRNLKVKKLAFAIHHVINASLNYLWWTQSNFWKLLAAW